MRAAVGAEPADLPLRMPDEPARFLTWIECRLAEEVDSGDHTFFVGEVLSAEPGTNAAPLVHVGQEYRSL